MSCEIAESESSSRNTVDTKDLKGNNTIYFHLKKFFRGTRFTFKPFLQSLQAKHKEGEIVCVSGKVSSQISLLFGLILLYFYLSLWVLFSVTVGIQKNEICVVM